MQNDDPVRNLPKNIYLMRPIGELQDFLQTLTRDQITAHKSAFETAVAGLTALSYLVSLPDDKKD